MTGWLLGPNVSFELRSPRPSARVREFVAQQSLELLLVSEVTALAGCGRTLTGAHILPAGPTALHRGLTAVTRA